MIPRCMFFVLGTRHIFVSNAVRLQMEARQGRLSDVLSALAYTRRPLALLKEE